MLARLIRLTRPPSLSAAIIACAVAAALFAVAVSSVVIRRPPDDSAENVQHLLTGYWPWYLLAWAALTQLARTLRRRYGTPVVAQQAIIILTVAAATRLFVVFTATPQFSDDIWRHIHDGRTLASGGNPHQTAPVERPADPILRRISSSDPVTICLPTSQWVFAALWSVSWEEYADRTFRLGFVLFDLAIIAMLIARLHTWGRGAWWAILYAWHPLTISEVAASGHQDVIGIAMLMASLSLADCARPHAALLAGGAFAAAAMVKPIILPLAPLILWAMRSRPRDIALACASAVATGAALVMPFIAMPGGIGRLLDAGEQLTGTWTFNGSIHAIIIALGASAPAANVVVTAMLLLVAIVLMIRRIEVWHAAGIYFLATVLLSSAAHPWHLLWALAFGVVPVRSPGSISIALWMVSATIAMSYAALADTQARQLPTWVVICEYLPVYALLAIRLVQWSVRAPR